MSIKLPKIFLDSGNPEETKRAKGLLGFLDGQTTNPSLVAKHPEAQKILKSGKKLSEKALFDFYKQIIKEIDKELAGPLSVEVNANWDTKAADMLTQARDMFTWGHNIYLKFPTTNEGLKAANQFVKEGGRVNMTLVFDQNQAAAVYSATIEAKHHAFVSPFMGRWDDRGFNGLDFVKNVLKMYRNFDKQRHIHKSHMQVLAASLRTMDHFYACIFMGADIMTVPLKIIQDWVQEEKWMPDEHYRIEPHGLKKMIYEDTPFHQDFSKYDIKKVEGSLLDEGIGKFVKDWNSLVK